jgi:F-type H+-transporting ATPase subunit epsilon
VTPEAQLLDEQVIYASVPAWDGLLGVEHGRAPLLVKLGNGTLRVDFAQGGSRRFFVGQGFAQMKDNKLVLLTPEAVPAEDIVEHDAAAALQKAQGEHAISDDQVARKERLVGRAKALLALQHTAGAGR